MRRWIIHVDMDAFFASVEQRDHPEFREKPVIVGGLGNRGVVSTASYEARRYGVHSAMPMSQARRLCPQGIFLPGSHRRYGAVSRQIHAILAEYSPLVEPLSLDEAFLDVTGMGWLYHDPVAIAREIKARIKTETELTASAGVAPNKLLAKLASDWRKPDGLVVVQHGQEAEFLRNIPVGRLWGIGKVAAQELERLGIRTIGELAAVPAAYIVPVFHNQAEEILQLARGQDDRPVSPDAPAKSVGKETTFETDITSPEVLEKTILELSEQVGWRLRRMGSEARTVTLKLRFASFRTITRAKTLYDATTLDEVIYETARDIFRAGKFKEPVRLVGVSVSHIARRREEISLFAEADTERRLAVTRVMDELKTKYGETVLVRGRTEKISKPD